MTGIYKYTIQETKCRLRKIPSDKMFEGIFNVLY